MKNEDKYKTKDFYNCCLLRAYGIPLLKLERETGKIMMFHFDADIKTCEKILELHWNRELKLETRLLIETINEMKSRIYESN